MDMVSLLYAPLAKATCCSVREEFITQLSYIREYYKTNNPIFLSRHVVFIINREDFICKVL